MQHKLRDIIIFKYKRYLILCAAVLCVAIIYYVIRYPLINAYYSISDLILKKTQEIGLSTHNINVYGLKSIDRDTIMEKIGSQQNSMFDINMNDIRKRIMSLSMVKDVVIARIFPNTLNIHITEYKVIAYVQDGDDILIVTKDGKLINAVTVNENVPGILAKIEDVTSALRIILHNNVMRDKIQYVISTKDKRFDIITRDRSRIALPRENPEIAIDHYISLGMTGSVNMKVRDRVFYSKD